MDLFHRELQGHDTRTGRECQFCSGLDPDFAKRDPLDRLVVSNLNDTAAAHLTEDGYVRHRIAELLKKSASSYVGHSLAKTA